MTIHQHQKLTNGSYPPVAPPAKNIVSVWKTLSKKCTVVKLSPKEALFETGDSLKHIYIVISGFLLLDNDDSIFDILEPGHAIGAAFLGSSSDDKFYPVSASALNHCEVLEISVPDAYHLIKADQLVLNYFFEQLRHRLDYLHSCRLLQCRPVATRVAHFLLKKNSLINSSLITRKMIAQAVGTSTETVIRTLGEFQKNRLIECKGKKIKVLNHKYLGDLSSFSPIKEMRSTVHSLSRQ